MDNAVYLISFVAAIASATSYDNTDFCQFPGVRYARNPEDPNCSYRSCFPSAKKGQQFVIRCPPGTKMAADFMWSTDSGYAAAIPCSTKDVNLETCYFSANVPGKNSYINNMKRMERYVAEHKYAKAPTHQDYAKQKSQSEQSYAPKQVHKAPAPPKEDGYYVESASMYEAEERYPEREPEYPRYRPAPRQRYESAPARH